MFEIFKESIKVEGANVPFFTYAVGEDQIFEFDTSKCGSPAPMVNAMAGLKLLDTADKKLVMINNKKPGGLLDKVGENYDIEIDKLKDGSVKLTFSYKAGESEKADLSDNTCG